MHGCLNLLCIIVPPLHLFLVLLTEGLVCYLQASLALLKRVHPGKEDKGKGRKEGRGKGERGGGGEGGEDESIGKGRR